MPRSLLFIFSTATTKPPTAMFIASLITGAIVGVGIGLVYVAVVLLIKRSAPPAPAPVVGMSVAPPPVAVNV